MSATDLKYCCVMALSLAGGIRWGRESLGKKPLFGLPSVWTFLPLHSQKTLQKKRVREGRGCQWTRRLVSLH